jgi:integrase
MRATASLSGQTQFRSASSHPLLTCALRYFGAPIAILTATSPSRAVKLQMKVSRRKKVSFSWAQAEKIADHVGKMATLGKARREQYSTLFLLAAASGLRSSELLALRANDIDFGAKTVRVEESSDQRGRGEIGPCKNATAYRTVLLCDPEGRKAMRKLARLLGIVTDSQSLIFHSKRGGPLLGTNILNQGLHPAPETL